MLESLRGEEREGGGEVVDVDCSGDFVSPEGSRDDPMIDVLLCTRR